jgi:hypothetical protein
MGQLPYLADLLLTSQQKLQLVAEPWESLGDVATPWPDSGFDGRPPG